MNISPIETIVPYLPYLIPLFVLQMTLLVWALVALLRPKSPPRLLNRWVWLAIILCVSWIGPIVFLTIGRTQDE